PRYRALDIAAVGVVDGVLADVRAVDGEAGDDLAQGETQAGEGEVARGAGLLRPPIELGGEHVQLARPRHAQDQRLFLIRYVGERRVVLCPLAVEARQRSLAGRIDKQSVDLVEEIVPRRAARGPVARQRLVGAENLLDDDVQRPFAARSAE